MALCFLFLFLLVDRVNMPGMLPQKLQFHMIALIFGDEIAPFTFLLPLLIFFSPACAVFTISAQLWVISRWAHALNFLCVSVCLRNLLKNRRRRSIDGTLALSYCCTDVEASTLACVYVDENPSVTIPEGPGFPILSVVFLVPLQVFPGSSGFLPHVPTDSH